MLFDNEHPSGNLDKKRKSLQTDEKSVVAILFADNALELAGFYASETVEVEIGEVYEGDLAAVLLTDGRWFVGYISFNDDGVILTNGHDHRPPPFFHAKMIAALGQVFRRRTHTTPCVPTNIWGAVEPDTFVPRSSPVMTWQMNAKGVVTYADPLCRQFLGLTEEQLRAGLWKQRLHPDDREQYLRARERALAENTVYKNRVRVLDARDEYCLMSIMVLPIRSDGGLVTGWQAVAELAEGLIKRSA